MHGDVAYCRKHGHNWHTIDYGHLEKPNDDIVWKHEVCKRCGVNTIIYAFFGEGDE